MLNITKSYVTIWQPEDKRNYVQARLSSSRKDKRNNTWVNSNWFARFVGDCARRAADLEERDKIIITNGTVENVYDKEKNRTWLNVTVFDFELNQSRQSNASSNQGDIDGFVPMEDDVELPF